MGLDLTPRDYLHMLREEYREYQEYWHTHGYRVSIRKAINCCGHSNALPEIITAHRNPADPPEALDKKVALYREELRQRCQAHHTVRDICEFYKHGPTLRRQSKPEPRKVSVQIVKRIIQPEGFYQGLAALTETREVERLEIRHERDGRTESVDQVLEQVIASWNTIFDQDKL